jgi:hypothetical protein
MGLPKRASLWALIIVPSGAAADETAAAHINNSKDLMTFLMGLPLPQPLSLSGM